MITTIFNKYKVYVCFIKFLCNIFYVSNINNYNI